MDWRSKTASKPITAFSEILYSIASRLASGLRDKINGTTRRMNVGARRRLAQPTAMVRLSIQANCKGGQPKWRRSLKPQPSPNALI
jgi:hypothetical protein